MLFRTLRRRFSDASSTPAGQGSDRPGRIILVRVINPGPGNNKLLDTLPRKDWQD